MVLPAASFSCSAVPVHSKLKPRGKVAADTRSIAASASPDEKPGAGPPLIVTLR